MLQTAKMKRGWRCIWKGVVGGGARFNLTLRLYGMEQNNIIIFDKSQLGVFDLQATAATEQILHLQLSFSTSLGGEMTPVSPTTVKQRAKRSACQIRNTRRNLGAFLAVKCSVTDPEPVFKTYLFHQV